MTPGEDMGYTHVTDRLPPFLSKTVSSWVAVMVLGVGSLQQPDCGSAVIHDENSNGLSPVTNLLRAMQSIWCWEWAGVRGCGGGRRVPLRERCDQSLEDLHRWEGLTDETRVSSPLWWGCWNCM